MTNNTLSEFETTVLEEIKNYKKNSGWIAPRNIELSFGDGFESEIHKALSVLLGNKYIQAHGSLDSDGTYGAYLITPLGKQALQKSISPLNSISNITNSNIAINSENVVQNLKIEDPKIKQKIKELEEAIREKDSSKIKRAFGYIADKATDVAIILLINGMLK